MTAGSSSDLWADFFGDSVAVPVTMLPGHAATESISSLSRYQGTHA